MSPATPTMVLLPGLDGTGVMFRPFRRGLPAERRAVVVSYPRDEPLGYAELLPYVREALPAGEPCVLLGESFSGPLALMVAAERPAGLVAVVLCGSFVRNPAWWFPAWLAPLVRPGLFRGFLAARIAELLLGADATPELRALLAEALTGPRPEVLAHRVRAVLRVNVTRELEDCPAPILYLRGGRDRVVPRRSAGAITALRPSVEVACLDSAPHLVLQSEPEAALAAIERFLARVRGGSSVSTGPSGSLQDHSLTGRSSPTVHPTG